MSRTSKPPLRPARARAKQGLRKPVDEDIVRVYVCVVLVGVVNVLMLAV